MRRLLSLLALALPLSGQIPTPSQHLKIDVGADRVLADDGQIRDYCRMLDAASPRVDVEVLGKTVLGEEMIMAVISSEENIRNKTAIKKGADRLADPRGLSDAEAQAIFASGK